MKPYSTHMKEHLFWNKNLVIYDNTNMKYYNTNMKEHLFWNKYLTVIIYIKLI